VVGQWVRGERFYGRERELAALGAGLRSTAGRRLWIAGLRRIGKTSLLRQLELLALAGAAEGAAPVLPLYWDLQEADEPDELAPSLDDALLDAGEAFERLGLDPPAPGGGDPAALLERLGADLAAHGASLLLLCDEADRLATLAGSHPGRVRALWRAAAGAGRVVIATTVRLADLAGLAGAEGGGAAEAVEGFGEPHLLGSMPPAEARDLVRQSRLPEIARPRFDAATVEAIRERCGDHPMLLQLAGRRCQESGDAAAALDLLAAERTVEHLFEVDLELLAGVERWALAAIAAAERDGAAGRGAPDPGDPALRRLLALGLVGRAGAGVAIRNRLLAAWLHHRAAAGWSR
jgi:hypothetical protein